MVETKPYPFQVDALDAIERRFDHRAVLALSMGLGKTPISLWHFAKHPEMWPGLVICPGYLKAKWMREATKHINMPAMILSSLEPKKIRGSLGCPLYIINYDILGPRRRQDGGTFAGWLEYLLDKLKPRHITIDESQALSLTAQWTEYVAALTRPAKAVLALSGTPFWNYPSGIWPTLNVVRPDLFPAFMPFAMRYCAPQKNKYGGWSYRGAENLPELRKFLKKHLLFRRRKADVIKDLPEKIRTVVPMELPNRKDYDIEVKRFLAVAMSSGNKSDRDKAFKWLGDIKQMVAAAKMGAVIEWIDAFLANTNDKLLMFAWHRRNVEMLHKEYRKRSVMIYGGMNQAVRDAAEAAFQSDPKIRILFGNMKAAGTGLDLTAAHHVAFCEMAWNPGTHIQCEDRAYGRLNDMHGANIWYLVAEGTVEDYLCELNQRKMGFQEELLDGDVGIEGFNVFDQLIHKMSSNGRKTAGW